MSTPTEAPRRLRAADVIATLEEALANVTTRSAEPYVSVEFTRNAKGETQINVKTSAPGGTTQEQLEALSGVVYAEAAATYNAACQKYPKASE